MAKKLIYNKKDNPARNFMIIISEIRRMSRENNIAESKMMGDLAKDLENIGVEGYEKRLPDVSISGLEKKEIKTLIDFLNKMKKDAEKREGRMRKENDPKTLEQKSIREKEKAKRKEEQKVCTLWNEICELVEKKSKKEGKPISKCWVKVKNGRFPKDSKRELNSVELRIKKMIEDETYYQEVKYFTLGFKFLAIDSLTANALYGNSNRKFSDIESYNRYCELREKINISDDEKNELQRILMNEKTDDVTRKILEERVAIMKTQKNITYIDTGDER